MIIAQTFLEYLQQMPQFLVDLSYCRINIDYCSLLHIVFSVARRKH